MKLNSRQASDRALSAGSGILRKAIKDSTERAHLIFLLLTPNRIACIEDQLLVGSEGLFKSEYVTD